MHGSLFRKYATVLMLFVGVSLIVSGALEAIFNYRDTLSQVDAQLATEARAAGSRIEQ